MRGLLLLLLFFGVSLTVWMIWSMHSPLLCFALLCLALLSLLLFSLLYPLPFSLLIPLPLLHLFPCRILRLKTRFDRIQLFTISRLIRPLLFLLLLPCSLCLFVCCLLSLASYLLSLISCLLSPVSCLLPLASGLLPPVSVSVFMSVCLCTSGIIEEPLRGVHITN